MKFYQPSGKISGWFFLYFMVCLVGIVPLVAYGYTLAAGYVVRQKLKIVVFIICGVMMEFCCQDLVIRKGKVRNQRVAVWTALALSIVFMTVSCMAAFYIYGSFGGFGVRGIQLFSLCLFLAAGFTAVAGKPFCEKSKKWMREFSLYFALPDHITTLLQKLIANEESVIDELRAVPFSYDSQSGRRSRAIMDSHLLFELWTEGGTSEFYLTVVEKTAKLGRGGRIHYSEEELVRYMAVSQMMGSRLFTYAGKGDHQVLFVNKRGKRGFSMEKLRSAIQDAMSMALLVLMYTQMEEQFGGRVPMSVFYFYGISVFIISLLSLIGSFIKEPVVRSERLNCGGDSEISGQYIEMADSGFGAKLYYTALFIGSVGYMAAAVWYLVG